MSNYTISWSLYIQCSTKPKLLKDHWPQISACWDVPPSIREIPKRANDTGPFHVFATSDFQADDYRQAMVNCLEQAFRLSEFWTVSAPELGCDGQLASFVGSFESKVKGRSPVKSVEFMLFRTGSQELLEGGIAMRVLDT